MDTCFGYIGHYQTGSMCYMSKSVKSILGYSPEYFVKSGVDALRSVVHPDDMLGIVQTIVENTKDYQVNFANGVYDKNPKVINYYFRAKHAQGHWIPVNQKVFVLTFTETGLPDLLFSILASGNSTEEKHHIDKYLTKERILVNSEEKRSYSEDSFTFKNSTAYNNGGVVEITTHSNPVRDISVREKEVLKLIADGYATKEIANKLEISFHTVESHRKNLIQKFEVKNSAELVKVASKYYWLGE